MATNCRITYGNLITDVDMITASSAPAGFVARTAKAGTGSGTAYFQGDYSGDNDDKYIVEIDSVAAGAEVAEATYRWKKESDSSWQASGVATSTSWAVLDNDVQVNFASGDGDDFALGDRFTCLAVLSWGKARLIDRDRDHQWRSTGVTSEYIEIDLGSAQQVTALCLLDHNLTNGATITLKGDADGAGWGSPDYSQAVTWRSGIMILYLDQTYRYWRVEFADAANGDGYLQVAELCLATYFEPSRQFVRGYDHALAAGSKSLKSDAQILRAFTEGEVERYKITFKRAADADKTSLQAWWRSTFDKVNKRVCPFYFDPFPGSAGGEIWCLPASMLSFRNVINGRHDVTLALEEVAKSD